MSSNEFHEIYVPLKKEILMKNLYWTINKFNEDPHHKQQNSSREDLIGGFFDRWINRIPEFLIFNEFLKSEGYSPVIDNFIYSEKTSKNAPDIIGLRHNITGKYFKFAEFNNNRWEFNSEAPFIEMKVFRSSQNLITIPETQFKPWKYYAIVESDVPENYLVSVFDEKNFFRNSKFFDELNDEEIKENFANGKFGLYNPKKLEPLSDLGGFKLLGIYKGSVLEFYGKYVSSENGNPISPIYLKKGPKLFTYENSEKINEGLYTNYFYATSSIPVVINKDKDSEISITNSSEFCILINIVGSVMINNKEYSDGDYNLHFVPIFRNCVKYYYLRDVKPVTTLIVEKDLILNSGLLINHGGKQVFVDCSFEINDSSLDIVVLSKSNIIFKVEGNVSIDGEDYTTGLYKFKFVSHDEEKSSNNLSYRMLEKQEELLNLSGTTKSNRFFVSIPDGNHDFDSEYLENPEFDFSNVYFDVIESNVEIIEKNAKKFIIGVNGKVELEDDTLYKGIHLLRIGSKNKKFRIKSSERNIIHPLYNPDAIDLRDYLYYENNSYGIIDFSLININNNSNESSSNNSKDKKEKVFIPISIKLNENSTLKVHDLNNSKMIVSIDGSAEINKIEIDDSSNDVLSTNFFKLEFDTFKRTSKKGEFILSKKALESSNISSEQELLDHIRYFTQNSC